MWAVAECVIDGQTGLLANPADENGLADAVVGLLKDPIRRKSLGDAARELVQGNFGIKNIARRYIDFYYEVLTSKRTPPLDLRRT